MVKYVEAKSFAAYSRTLDVVFIFNHNIIKLDVVFIFNHNIIKYDYNLSPIY